MITLNPQTEHKLQEMASQSGQSVQQLIESLLADYQAKQECIKRADQGYADYLKNGESISLAQIKQDNGHPSFYSLQFVISTKERSYAQCLKIPRRSCLTSLGMTRKSASYF